MKILLPLALLVTVLLFYALWGRDWLKTTAAGERFLSWVEPVEIMLFKKSETILFGRTLTVLGGLLTFLTQIGSIDITPLMPLVPEKYAGVVRVVWNLLPMLVSGLGLVVEKLRYSTTKPIELVAVPDKVIAANPIVAEALAQANDLKEQAVAVTEIAVAESKVA